MLIVAALLRLYRLGAPETTGDENYLIHTIDKTIAETIAERAAGRADVNIAPPGYPLLTRWTRPIVSTSRLAFHSTGGRFGVRFTSALAGTLTVLFLFLLARHVAGAHAWIPAALYAVSFYAVYFARENTPYAVIALLAMLSTWLFFEAFVNNRRRLAPAYVVAVAALGYMRYETLLVPASHAAAFAAIAVVSKKNKKDVLFSPAPAPWLRSFISPGFRTRCASCAIRITTSRTTRRRASVFQRRSVRTFRRARALRPGPPMDALDFRPAGRARLHILLEKIAGAFHRRRVVLSRAARLSVLRALRGLCPNPIPRLYAIGPSISDGARYRRGGRTGRASMARSPGGKTPHAAGRDIRSDRRHHPMERARPVGILRP
ncbi:MAG: glycosyltransferase family 39 protein [Deltaproteobacteria bacterium]|nr:glycosyltransferase family 39 protein [Deltaproteobacteria bacterium]